MPYTVEVAPPAVKSLRSLDRTTRRRLTAAIDALADDPRPPGCAKMKGEDDLWRVRVGDYRIVYETQDERLLVLVLAAGHRKDIYRKGR